MFWDDLKVVLNSLNITVRFDIKDVLFWDFRYLTVYITVLVNNILLEGKYFIYRRKLNKGSLCLRLLADKFKKENFSNRTFYRE